MSTLLQWRGKEVARAIDSSVRTPVCLLFRMADKMGHLTSILTDRCRVPVWAQCVGRGQHENLIPASLLKVVPLPSACTTGQTSSWQTTQAWPVMLCPWVFKKNLFAYFFIVEEKRWFLKSILLSSGGKIDFWKHILKWVNFVFLYRRKRSNQ